jgi:flagellar protein FliO/FliZ
MELLGLFRTLGALTLVLGLLGAALWAVRRYDLRLPGRVGGSGPLRRLELVERTALDTRRAVALVRRDGREHLILLAPEGNSVIETMIVRDEVDAAAEAERVRAAEAQRAATEAAMAEARAELAALRARAGERLASARGEAQARARTLLAGTGARIVQARSFAELVMHGPPPPPAEPEPVAKAA